MKDVENKKYYLEQLKDQVSFLIDACHSYDSGNFKQAKIISSIIRTLVKDPDNPRPKNKTKSLLTLLNKKSLDFYNTGFESKHPKFVVDLVGTASVPNKFPTVSPEFDHIFLPILEASDMIDLQWLSFREWWESQILFVDAAHSTSSFTRRRIVLTMAEQDGGAHVDSFEDIDKEYKEIASAAKSYFSNVNPFGKESLILYMHYAMVRQIAHELLVSLIREFKISQSYKPTNIKNLKGLSPQYIKQPPFVVEGAEFLSTRTNKPYKLKEGDTITTPPDAAFMRLNF